MSLILKKLTKVNVDKLSFKFIQVVKGHLRSNSIDVYRIFIEYISKILTFSYLIHEVELTLV